MSMTSPAADDRLEERSITELQAAMHTEELTARQLAEHYLERIESIDKSGPRLNAVIEPNPDALAIADALDAERRAGRTRGPLHGIPILIKDNIDTGDRMTTTAGSPFAGSRATISTVAPASASWLDTARPMPDVPPVTRAMRSLKVMFAAFFVKVDTDLRLQ